MKQRPTNMIPRTKTIKTPVEGKEVEIKAYFTGREKLDMMKAGDDVEKIIKASVVSVNGEKENAIDKFLAMHGKDFDFVVNEINKVAQESSILEKKKK